MKNSLILRFKPGCPISNLYGWRGRIGVVVASTNGVVEMESFKMLPDGVSVHFARIPYAGTGTTEAGEKMVQNLESCSKLLAGSDETIGVNVIGLAHGSGSAAVDTSGGVSAVAGIMSKVCGGIPAFTASDAIIMGLRKLGAKTISIGLPLNQSAMIANVKGHLERNGFEVRKVGTMGLPHHQAVSAATPEDSYRLMKEIYQSDVDAIVINNSNLRTLEIIDVFEKDYGKPVLASNQALMWACLRAIGVHDSPAKLGRIFQL